MSQNPFFPKTPIETVLVCYTQATFDTLEAEADTERNFEETSPELAHARYLVTLAGQLCAGLQLAGCTAEIVKVPQVSFRPRDISKAAFTWRMLDLTESNGRRVDLALCLDFPAWSLQHSQKWVWLTALPNFVSRSRMARPAAPVPPLETTFQPFIELKTQDQEAEQAQAVAALLQAERRGLAEAQRLLAGSRPVAEELARRGLQVEFNPLPTDLAADLASQQWQTAIARLLGRG